MKMVCPDCGKQYELGKFCQECGTKLQEVVPQLVCPSCGYKTKTGKFCPECGSKLLEQLGTPSETEKTKPQERSLNEIDERFSKYYDRKGFPRTIPQEERDVAIEELTQYADKNIAEAKMLLGGILMSDSTNKDTALKGVMLLKEAEAAGDKLAYYLMGVMYFYGADTIIKQNHEEAEKRLLEAYHKYRDENTAGLLAELYTYSKEKCDYKKAFEYATTAAEDDDRSGYQVLGALYLNGWGVEKDANLALENYKMAAALGDETAMNQIGFIFMGDEGIEANLEQAFYWFNEAARKSSDVGMYNLGCCYKEGLGVEADIEQAAYFFKKAADMEYVDAMLELGKYYQSTLIDLGKAKMWLSKAAELGNSEAQDELYALSHINESDKKSNVDKGLPMELIRETAEKSYSKKSLKQLAVAVLKIAEVIQERLPNEDVSYMVHPSAFDSSVTEDALPVHFLFKKNGVPKVAVVAVTENGYRTPFVQATADACKKNDIEYIKVYANGPFADWIEGWSLITKSPVSNKSVEFCKNWLVEKIVSHL